MSVFVDNKVNNTSNVILSARAQSTHLNLDYPSHQHNLSIDQNSSAHPSHNIDPPHHTPHQLSKSQNQIISSNTPTHELDNKDPHSQLLPVSPNTQLKSSLRNPNSKNSIKEGARSSLILTASQRGLTTSNSNKTHNLHHAGSSHQQLKDEQSTGNHMLTVVYTELMLVD